MAIIDKIGQGDTITEGWRALKLFTDRDQAIRHFSSYLNDDPPRERILFFHGGGGTGKSLLLRFLRENCCKRLRPEDWEYVKTMQDEEFTENIQKAQDPEPVPIAFLDFGMQPRGEDRPQEAFSALLMLRRALAGHDLHLPLYDFACVWYLHKTKQLSEQKLANLFPTEEMDFVTAIVDLVDSTVLTVVKPGIGLGKAVLGLFDKHMGERFALYKHRRKLDEAQVEAVKQMEPESELIDQLPHLFARDLNTAMALDQASKRIVFFFDTHEAFWGARKGDLSRDLFFQSDEWLRRLLATLELKDGIVAVVAGRGLPRWADADRIMIPDKCLDTQLVGYLSETDATKFLEGAGVADAAMRQCLIAYTRVAPERVNEVHPLYLGLCFDVVRAASEQGTTLTPEDFRVTPHAENKGRELINRLLRYVDTEIDFSVRALSACRAFNREIYFKLGEALNFQVTEPAFGVLKQFSFVWRVESRGEGWYRIHDLLRRLFLEHGEEVARRADEVLEKHYRERGSADDMAGSAEAIYHSNRLDWERGINEWVEVFDSALSRSNYALCRILIQVRNELLVKTKFELGRLSQLVGNYFAKLARHNEARDEYLESISAYDEALKRAPDLVEAHNNKGLALQSLGNLQAALSQHQEALSSYTASISAYDEALKRAPDYVGAHNNKGNALQSLGNLQAALSQHQEAMNCYEIALKEFCISLKIAPADKRIHERKDRLKKSMEELRRT